jgi:NADH:ubiquinone oxidoreductase subunit F (NADH-binding)/NAD-dependent dihydropyrimidine dehydrogenase PreA subunit/(2Fe-2S) ferredoxin
MSAPVRSEKDLDALGAAGLTTLYPNRLKILIGSATCGIAAGAREVEAAAIEAIKELKLDAVVARTGCIGFCQREPLLDLTPPGGPRISYGNMTARKTRELLEAYAAKQDLKPELALCRFEAEEHVPTGETRVYPPSKNGVSTVPAWSALGFNSKQKRVILRNCGSIDPQSIREAIARGAYRGAARALAMKPEEVIASVLSSGLRGRGGAGFPTGQKWDAARRNESDVKYVVCNADEGDPGAFMDRSVLEGDPHAVIEGMIVGAYAIGAREAIIYVRSEYPLAVSTIQSAIKEAEAHGLLGEDLFGSGFSLNIKVRRGAGAFVCGEETSLIASIEGHSGEPRTRPPYPAQSGLWGKPTVINNVKTWASVGAILARGPAWYSAMGAERNRGTTVFSLVGAVKNTGLVEVPLGLTLREMVYDIGGGMAGKRPLKAIQTGGPSGGCLPASMLDLAIDYEKLGAAGSMMGSGGMIVIDTGTCMVDLARFFLTFTAEESCGKCAPCREGTRHMLRILTRICEGQGVASDLDTLERLAATVKSSSLCGLGATAPNPVLTALRYFRPEFEAHLCGTGSQTGKMPVPHCPAGVCRKLITMRIDEQRCSGCGRCVEVCGPKAIRGERKQPHRIDPAVCTRCGACKSVCPTEAVASE